MKIVVCWLLCFGFSSNLFAQQDRLSEEKNWTQKTIEIQPEFPGCEILMNGQDFEECQRREISHFLIRNMDLPSISDSVANFSGMIVASAIVDKQDGHVRNPTIIRPVYPSCDQAFLDVILKMPNWKPGKVENKQVDVEIVVYTKVFYCN